MIEKILDIDNLSVSYGSYRHRYRVVEDVGFYVGKNEIIGLVGESGSGKSVTSRAIMGMIKKPGAIDSGSIRFKGKELIKLPEKEYRKLRCQEIAMIFQEPMTSLNPVYTIGEQFVETVSTHLGYTRHKSLEYGVHMLDKVGISIPESRLRQYPHELSGGMRQRVMIAIALSCNPDLLIADEPTTALDVTIQAQILEILKSLCHESDMSTIVVTHDMGIVAEMCSRVVVMYAGQIVEISNTQDLFAEPAHPYTEALLKSIPRLGERPEKLYTIPGSVLTPGQKYIGCRFSPRCSYCTDRCKSQHPPLFTLNGNRQSRCWLREGGGFNGRNINTA